MHTRILTLGVLVITASGLVGCSSSDSTGGDTSTGGTDAGTTEDSGTAGDSGTPSDAGTMSLKAPKLDMLMKMGGALHVMWTNEQSDCDTVRIERTTTMDAWAEKFSVPGTVDNKMDGTATADTDYTYRLRCEKGGVFSDYSNELTKNPTQ